MKTMFLMMPPDCEHIVEEDEEPEEYEDDYDELEESETIQ